MAMGAFYAFLLNFGILNYIWLGILKIQPIKDLHIVILTMFVVMLVTSSGSNNHWVPIVGPHCGCTIIVGGFVRDIQIMNNTLRLNFIFHVWPQFKFLTQWSSYWDLFCYIIARMKQEHLHCFLWIACIFTCKNKRGIIQQVVEGQHLTTIYLE